MTREEAIKISKYLEEKEQKMTELERALTHIKTRADAWAVKEIEKALSQEPCDKPMRDFTEEEAKAYSKALDKMYKPTGFNVFDEPCTDAVSRRKAISVISACDGKSAQIEALEKLPSVTQKPIECDDAISREDAEECKELMTDINGDTVYAVRMSDIRQLPPVTPQTECLKTQAKKQAMPMSCDDCCYEPNSPFCEMYRKDICEKKDERQSGKCKNCKYFEYDSVAKVDGIPLIVAHEICNKWGGGCKTREDGYCYLFEPQESEDKE